MIFGGSFVIFFSHTLLSKLKKGGTQVLIKKSKVIVLVLIMAFVVSVLAGCGGSNQPQQQQPSQPQAQDNFPSKPVELIVPLGAGGSHDLHARAIVGVINEFLGGPMIVTLKPGGSGAIGAEYVKSSRPDGYTLLFGQNMMNTSLHHVRELPYTREDFVPIAKINHSPTLLIVRSDSPFQTTADLIEYAKKNPGKLTYSSSGNYGQTHVTSELLAQVAGVDFVHVPFDGGGPALMAVLGGQVDFGFVLTTQTRPLLEAGQVRVLACSGAERIDDAVFKDVPTLKEQGYDVVINMWRGILAPKDTPEHIVNHLREAFKKTCEDPTFKRLIEGMGEKVIYLDGPDFQKEWDKEFEDTKFLKNL